MQLPPRPPVFLGRAAELEQVAARLADPDCRLLTVLGPGGMGKTLLAVEAARTQGDRFADGVWFVDLAPVNAPDQIAGAILRGLALPAADPAAAPARLLAELATRQTLLVLDNFEHLLAGAERLPPLLRGAPGLKLLVTSRARLHLAEEWLLPLSGLATPPAPAGGRSAPTRQAAAANQLDLAGFPSMRLFLQRMQRLEPSLRPTPADLEQIADDLPPAGRDAPGHRTGSSLDAQPVAGRNHSGSARPAGALHHDAAGYPDAPPEHACHLRPLLAPAGRP